MSISPIRIQNTYDVSRMKTLIDLSGHYDNYRLDFRLSSNAPFSAVVLSQSTLDTTEDANLDFVYVESELEGEVVSDTQVTEPYYLILKSAKPCKVNVTFQFTELPREKPQHVTEPSDVYVAPHAPQPSTFTSIHVFYIILLLFAIAVGYLVYKSQTTKPPTLLQYYRECVEGCKIPPTK